MTVDFKSVDAKTILNIRHRVLRQGKPIDSCHFNGDNAATTYHIAAFTQDKIIACVSLINNTNKDLQDQQTYQLRGMAVLENYQGQKIGQDLLTQAEKQLVSINIKTVWCNVRIKAIPFYKKNHYFQIGEIFNIPEVGPHVLMYKNI